MDATLVMAKRVPDYHPIGRIGRFEEVAATVMYLFSEGTGFTTGHGLTIDGGMTAI